MKPGSLAGYLHKHSGYWFVRVDKKMYLGHRLAWLYVYGKYPKNNIDHINRDRSDNRITNLRDVTSSQNNRRRLVSKNSQSGYKGVRKNKNCSTWSARIKKDKVEFHLGCFKTKEDAAVAYNKKAEEFFGQFASLNSIGD
jgi:hypothetical protein